MNKITIKFGMKLKPIQISCKSQLYSANMSKKSCDFLGSKEALIDVGNTKTMGLVVCRGTDKRVYSQKPFAWASREFLFKNMFSNWDL